MDMLTLRAIVFDCDGVILNSNKIKTTAFFNAALPYGQEAAEALVDYHIANGGISRFHKFRYFLDNIVTPEITGPSLDDLLTAFASETKKGLLNCEVTKGLQILRDKTINIPWFLVSGGKQTELREMFQERGLADMFDGIFGSPDTKDLILSRLINENNLAKPALFLGDSRYDHQAAHRAGLDFIFVSGWSEFKEWTEYCLKHSITSIHSVESLNNIAL